MGSVAAIAYDASMVLITVIAASTIAYLTYRTYATRRGITQPLAATTGSFAVASRSNMPNFAFGGITIISSAWAS
jgi:hypothetical protein